ncbi:mitochondrial arginine transporter BAC1 isoform X2 [Gossypium australe]|uniref:Mitochondrial arginine transporter BAC1 isoform X2 n=1 Tax=Gossypium australe TaxID=47621 RepID=A0A5B6X997_9ROSI|nr:mitochondrial arginine transporter BAC1 isoform X2 [Gossypium australe]
MVMEDSRKPSGYKEYLAGLFAGVATVVVGHPFDTVKVKLQKHNTNVQGITYRNGFHCTARILATEGVCSLIFVLFFSPSRTLFVNLLFGSEESGGSNRENQVVGRRKKTIVRGLYIGATPSFVGMAFESSLLFGIYSQTKQSLQGGVQSSRPQPQVIIPSAAFAGAIISFVLCPSELVKCRMQIQGTDSLVPKCSGYSSSLDCALKTIKSDGVTGAFRGGSTTFLRESIGNAVFFSVYEYVRYYLHLQLKSGSSDHNNLVDMGIGILSGGLGGVAFWSTVLPLDVAKTIIQTAPDKSSPTNPFLVLNSIYRMSGLRGCYTGLGPTILRAFPANAAAIVTWEVAMKLLGIKNN